MDALPRSILRSATHFEETSMTSLTVDLIGDLVDCSGDVYVGTGVQDRVGNRIVRTSVQLRFLVTPINTAFDAVRMVVRIALFWLHAEPAGGFAAFTTSYFLGDDFVAQPPWVSPYNDKNSHNFDVLYDESFPVSCPQEIPATAQQPFAISRNLFFDLKGLSSTYAGPLPSQQNGGFLYLLAAASAGGGGLPFASLDFTLKSKFIIKPF